MLAHSISGLCGTVLFSSCLAVAGPLPPWGAVEIDAAVGRYRAWKGADETVAFTILTDVHSRSPDLAEPIDWSDPKSHILVSQAAADRAACDFACDLGDIDIEMLPPGEPGRRRLMAQERLYRDYRSRPVLFAVGNHDHGKNGVVSNEEFGRRFNGMTKRKGFPVEFGDDASYGFLDLEAKRTRVIFLNTSDGAYYGYSAKQVGFLKRTLELTPKEWTVVVAQHFCILTTIGYWKCSPVTATRQEEVKALLRGFVARGGKLAGVFCGDSHFDHHGEDDGVHYVITQGYGGGCKQNLPASGCDDNDLADGATKTVFDPKQTCLIDLVAVKPLRGEVRIFRIGAGGAAKDRGYAYAATKRVGRANGRRLRALTWSCRGPGGGGWIESVLASRHAKDRFFVGCDVGGFYRSEDGGAHYSIGNAGLTDYFIECLAEHPKNPDTFYAAGPGGVQKTTDGGRHWVRQSDGFPPVQRHAYSSRVSVVRFHPTETETLYAASGYPRDPSVKGLGTIWKTVDGGKVWKRVNALGSLPDCLNIFDLSIDTCDARRLLITSCSGVFASADGGVTWLPSNDGLPARIMTRRLARSPSSPQRVYVTLAPDTVSTTWNAGVYRSDDGGRTWTDASNGLCKRMGENAMLCGWVDAIVVDPKRPDVVYAGSPAWIDPSVYKTTDGARSWTRAFNGEERGWIDFWGPSPRNLTISSVDPKILYYGTSGGIWKTSDAGKTWKPVYSESHRDGTVSGTGLEVTCVHAVCPHPQIRNRIYIAYFDIGLMRTDDNGRTFRRCMRGVPRAYGNSCTALAWDADDPEHLWGAFGQWSLQSGTVLESRDGGLSWGNPGGAITNAAPVARYQALLSVGDSLVALAEGRGVLRSDDGARMWHDANGSFAIANASALCQAKGALFVAVSAARGGKSSVWTSPDRGRSWRNLTPDGLPAFWAYGIASDGDTVYLATRDDACGGVWRGDPKGTWKRVYADRFAKSVAVNPAVRGHVYATFTDHPYHDGAVGSGVIESADGGETWQTANDATLTCRNVNCVSPDPFCRGAVWIGTAGNSAFYGTRGPQVRAPTRLTVQDGF